MILEISLGMFYSRGDERRLFQGLGEISSIRKVRGVGRIILLDIDEGKIDDEEMKELIGLLYRYNISLIPLQIFSKKEKFTWLSNSVKFWYKSMFKENPK